MKDALTAGMPPLHISHWQAWSLWLAILLFPFFAAGAQGGASYPFAWLVLIGLIFGWKFLPQLTKAEKQLFIGFAIFFIVIAISVAFGSDLKEDLRRLDRYSAMLWAFPAYLAIRRYVKQPGRPFIAGLLLAPIGALLFGLDWDITQIAATMMLQHRLEGFYATIILSNIAAILTILLLASSVIFFRHPAALLVGILMVMMGIIVVTATASRTGMLFIPIGIGASLILLHKYLSRQHIAALSIGLTLVIVLLAINPQNTATQRVHSAIETLFSHSDRDASTTLRFDMWKDSLLLWKQYPVIGVGPGSYHSAVQSLQASGETQSTHEFTHAHSIYFQALATLGTAGLLAMLWFAFAQPFTLGLRAWRHTLNPWQTFYASGIMLTVLAFMVFGLTEAWFSRNPMLRSYLICLIVLFAGLIETTQNSRTPVARGDTE